ncbi:hypothetical protein CDD81_7159 [Ophiocordyceps australis]|uniref:Uncharacterized protein n=1 Tax=Ophiocordyceps australis TaxID=1399860 RepID=A0A2C5Y4T3_9HYPO|nr:hypothetical protein CDD81_7159 [Ophiocordyceps australis]
MTDSAVTQPPPVYSSCSSPSIRQSTAVSTARAAPPPMSHYTVLLARLNLMARIISVLFPTLTLLTVLIGSKYLCYGAVSVSECDLAVFLLTVEALASFLWHSMVAFALLEVMRGRSIMSELQHANLSGVLATLMLLGLFFIIQWTLLAGHSSVLQPSVIIAHAVILTILMCLEFLTALCGWRWQHIHSLHLKVRVTG